MIQNQVWWCGFELRDVILVVYEETEVDNMFSEASMGREKCKYVMMMQKLKKVRGSNSMGV